MSPDSPNAFATVCKHPNLSFCTGAPVVCVNRSMLDRVIEGNADRLAFAIGHELSHITLNHLRPRAAPATNLLTTFFSRDKEDAADQAGIKATMRIRLAASLCNVFLCGPLWVERDDDAFKLCLIEEMQ